MLFRSRRLGAVTVNLPASEIVPALASGKIDGAEWVSPWCDMQLGLHEVCNYCYVPGIHEPGHTTELIINPKVWERLSPLHQEIMRAAAWQEGVTRIRAASRGRATRRSSRSCGTGAARRRCHPTRRPRAPAPPR